jgi:hypothetical protein
MTLSLDGAHSFGRGGATQSEDDREARAATGSDPLRSAWWELGALATLIAVIKLSEEFVGPAAEETLCWIAPIWLMAALLLGLWRMVGLDSRATLTSLFWFRLATATYFGFGSLVPLFINPEERIRIATFYDARIDEMLKLDLLCAVSSLLVLTSATVIGLLFPYRAIGRTLDRPHARLFYGLVFAGVGYTTKFLIDAPLTFGAFGAAVVPGIVLQLSQLSAVGMFLLSFHAFRTTRSLLPVVLALLAADLTISALMFAKTAMLLPLIMFLLGWLSARTSALRIFVAAVGFLAVYSGSQPFIEFGRLSLQRQFQSLDAGGLSERFEIIADYFRGDRLEAYQEDTQSSLTRLSYVNSGCFAMSRFDGGVPGPSLEYAFATVVPRFLWKDKPVITDIGVTFNVMATGNFKSSSLPGIFADAYWADGWRGVMVAMPLVGALFTFYSRFALRVIAQARWLLFPLVLLAIKMGLRVDGALVPDIIGASVIWLWIFVAMRLIEPRAEAFTELFASKAEP